MKKFTARQNGFSFTGFLFIVLALLIVLITAFRAVPAYIEASSIKQAFNAIVQDPELKNAKVNDIRMAFIKRAQVSDITAITPDDIDIENNAGSWSLSASYSVKIHLVGNVNLLLEFNPSAPE